eukprot:GGOE01020709.1.p2 GENE.GGOE01020709.1~~GGOE01020709.1.p2  ORF type:complete len:343 (+),score=87.28 GGOE01020709.1:38-1030(+)
MAVAVLQFNLLGRTLAEAKWFPHAKAFLPGVPRNAEYVEGNWAGPSHLQWDGPQGREAVLLRQLQTAGADILCLQEVDCFPALCHGLPQHTGHWTQRPGGRPDGCAIFWHSDKYALQQSHEVIFSDLSQRVGLVVLLLHLPSQRSLTVATTHLHWNRHVGVHGRQLQELQDAMQRPPFRGTATLLAADFNTPLDSEDLQAFIRSSGLKSVHVALGQTLERTSFVPGAYYYADGKWCYNPGDMRDAIDHILFSPGLQPTSILPCHTLPSMHCGDTAFEAPGQPPPLRAGPSWRPQRTDVPLEGLPNEHCGSDHLPIGAVFTFAPHPLDPPC